MAITPVENAISVEQALDYMNKHQDILLGDLESLPEENLHEKIFDDTMTVSASILHTAAFEFLLTSAIKADRGEELDTDLWERLEAGFPRDLGVEEPPRDLQFKDESRREFIDGTDQDLQYYMDILREVRAQTESVLRKEGTPKFEGIELEPVIEELVGSPEESAALSLSTESKLSSFENQPVDVRKAIVQHESYHRGQITFMKYLFSRGI